MNNYAKNVDKKTPFKKSSIKTFFSAVLGTSVFMFFTIFIILSDAVSELSQSGAATALYAVLPSTFPYLVLSGILMGTSFPHYIGKALSPLTNFFKIPTYSAFLLFASLVAGFPVSSSIAYDLFEKNSISHDECSRIAAFCSFCGPPFIISLFGKIIMNDIKAGIVCYAVQVLLSMALGRILAISASSTPAAHNKKNKNTDTPLSLLICDSISSGGVSMLKIISFVIFFSVLSGIVKKLLLLFFPSLSPTLTSILCGILEISTGVTSISELDISRDLKFILGCSYIYWSGFSVFFQVSSTMKGKISMKKYLLGRVFMVLLGTPISYFIYFLSF